MAVADDDLVSGRVYKPCGYARYATQLVGVINLDADPTDGKRLSECKGKPFRAIIQAETQAIRWTDDSEHDPTGAVGMLIPAGATLEYDGDLSKFRAIQAAATAIMHVSYYNT